MQEHKSCSGTSLPEADRRKDARGLGRRLVAAWRARNFSRLLGTGFWAIADQGLFAASNFALSVLLARWLTAQDYGAFTVAYSGFWFFGAMYTALVVEPMLVFGSEKYKERLFDYLGVLLYGQLGLSIVGALIFLAAGLTTMFVNLDALAPSLFSLAVACPLILFQWKMRRVCYLHRGPHLAASGGAIYMVLMLLGGYAMYRWGLLSAAMAFGLIAAASLVSGLWLMVRLRVKPAYPPDNRLARESLADHWQFGRWAMATNVVGMFSWNGYYLLLPIWGGLEATGAFRALMNLIQPVLHMSMALPNVLVPALTRMRGTVGFKLLVRRTSVAFVLCAAAYWLLLGVFHRQLIELLYGGQYTGYSGLLWLAGLLPLAFGVMDVLGSALRALERPDRMFVAYLVSTAVSLTAGLALLAAFGVVGAIVGTLVTWVTAVAALVWALATTGAKEPS